MPLTFEAVYENGVLKPARPLPLREQEKVQVSVTAPSNWVQESAGMFGWKGDAQELQRLALAPDLELADEQ